MVRGIEGLKAARMNISVICHRTSSSTLLRWCRYHVQAILVALSLVTVLAGTSHAGEGTLQWSARDQQAGKQQPWASTVDTAGNVIMAGFQNLAGDTNDDYWVVKYGANNGGILWRKTYNRAGISDQATAVVTDGNGDVIVTGFSSSGINKDIHTVKYNGTTGDVVWQQTYNGAAGGNDTGTAVAVDSDYDIYVAGYTQSIAGNDDFVLIKYSRDGNQGNGVIIWQQTLDGGFSAGDRALAVAVRGTMVALSGISGNGTASDILTVAYSTAGVKLWDVRKPASGSGDFRDSQGRVVGIDQNSDVIIGGVLANGNDSDIYVAKYAAGDGGKIWDYSYNGIYEDELNALTLDAAGNVYLAGSTWTSVSNNDFFTARLSAINGTALWQVLYDSEGGNADIAVATGIVLDPEGDLYVTGYTEASGNQDFKTVKYNRETGTLLWEAAYHVTDTLNDRPTGIGLADDGTVLVSGWSDTAAGSIDTVVLAYDPELLNPPTGLTATHTSNSSVRLTWTVNSTTENGFRIERCKTPTEYRMPCNPADFEQLPATAAKGATSFDDSGLLPDKYYAYRVRAFNAVSVSHYSNTAYGVTVHVPFTTNPPAFLYNSADNLDDAAVAVGVGPDSKAVIAGHTLSSSGGFNYYTVKLNPDMTTIWSRTYDSLQNEDDLATCVAVDNNGDAVISGISSLFFPPAARNINSIYSVKYRSSDGQILWNSQYNGPGGIDDRAVAVASATDGSSTLVVGYGENAAGNDDVYLVKYLADGSTSWSAAPYDGGRNDIPAAVALDRNGNAVVAGLKQNASGLVTDLDNYDFLVAKYAADSGTRLWAVTHAVAGGYRQARGVVADQNGDIYLAGTAFSDSARKNDIYLFKFSGTDGGLLWERSIDGNAHGDDDAVSVALESSSGELRIVVGGTVLTDTDDHDLTVARYTPDGTLVGHKVYKRPGFDDYAAAMSLDGNGTAFIAGSTMASGGAISDALTVKFTTAGDITAATIYNGAAGDNDWLSAIAVTPQGDAVSVGTSINGSGTSDLLVFKTVGDHLQPPPVVTADPGYASISLNWRYEPMGQSGYRLERKNGACQANGSWSLVNGSIAPASTSFTVSGLSANSTYCLRIRSEASGSQYSGWKMIQATTPVIPIPPQPAAAATNSTTATLTWSDSYLGVNGFYIERCAGAGCDFTTKQTFSVYGPVTYSDSTACPGTTYRYRLIGYGTGWTSPLGPEVEVTTPVPSAPSSLTASRVSEAQINLTWADNTGEETAYWVDRCEGSGCSTFVTIRNNLPANSTSYSDTDATLKANTTYTYRVQAVKTGACGWPLVSGTAEAITTLYAPAALTATATNTTRIDLAWQDRTSSESEFRIERCSGAGCTDFAQIATAAVNAVSSQDLSACINTLYRYQVKAARTGTVSWVSDPSTIADRQTADVTAPVLLVNRTSELQAILTWNDPAADETGFRIFRCTGTGCTSFVQIGPDQPPNTGTYTDNTLEYDKSYTYFVRAFKTATCAWTRDSSQITVPSFIPGPTGLTATTLDSTRVNLTWTDTTGSETGFEVERCQGASCSDFQKITTTAANAVSYIDTGACPTLLYRYKVRAVNSTLGWSTPYTGISEATTNGLPLAPTGFSAVRSSENMAGLSWTNPSGSDATGIRIERCAGSGCSNFAPLISLPGTAASYTDSGLTHATTYSYRVVATKATSCSGWDRVTNPVVVVTGLLPPTGFSAIPVDTTTIRLSWTDTTSSESGFDLERCSGEGCSGFAPLKTAPPNSTTTDDATVCAGQPYTYSLKASFTSTSLSNSGGGCWTRRRPLALSSLQSNSQIRVTIPYDSAMRADFADLRFADLGSNAELAYWLESKTDGVSASVWVKTGANNAVWLFFGNNSATSSSSGSTTFDFFDDFNGTTLDSAVWSATGSATVSGGSVRVNSGTVFSKNAVTALSQGKIFEMKAQWLNGTASHAGLNIADAQSTQGGNAGSNALAYLLSDNGTTAGLIPYAASGTAAAYNIASGTIVSTINALYNPYVSVNQNSRKPASGVWSAPNGASIARIHVKVASQTNYDFFYVYNAAGTVVWSGSGTQDTWISIAPTSGIYTVFTSNYSTQYGFGGDVPEVDLAMPTDPLNTYRIAGMEFPDTSQLSFFVKGADYSPIRSYAYTGTWNRPAYLWLGYFTGSAAGTTDIDDLQVDWVRVRRSLASEPIVSFGEIESGSCLTLGTSWNAAAPSAAGATTPLPSPPVGILATPISESAIRLDWTDTTSDETGFRVERCTGSGCSNFAVVAATVPAGSSSYTDRGLTPLTTYRYRVVAFKTASCGWVMPTLPIEIQPTVPAPGTPVPAPITDASCSDLRITDSTGTTALPYWIEEGSCNRTDSRIWVKVPLLAAGSSQLQLYHGNVTAASLSNGDTVFPFFDDFSGGAINTAKWTVADGTGFAVSNGTLQGRDTAGRIVSKSSFTSGNVIEFKAKTTQMPAGYYGYMLAGFITSDYPYSGVLQTQNWTGLGVDTESGAYYYGVIPAANMRYTFRQVNATSDDLTITNLDTGSIFVNTMYGYAPTYTSPIALGKRFDDVTDSNRSYATDWDWLFVRPHVTAEPSVAAGPAAYGTYPFSGGGWSARRTLTVSNANGSLSNFPTGLTVDTTPLATQPIRVAWTDTTDTETGFTLERCTGAGCSDFTPLANLPANQAEYVDRAVAANTTYCYRVKAVRSGMWESPYSVGCNQSASVPPPVLSTTSVRENRVDLAWSDNYVGEDAYYIERCTGAGCDFSSVDFSVQLEPNRTSYVDSAVCAGTAYRYQLRVFKAGGLGWTTTSAPLPVTTVTPAAPTTLTATRINESQVNLAWIDNTADETGFIVERCQGSGSGCSPFVQLGSSLPPNTASFTDIAHLLPNTPYTYRVRAQKTTGCPWVAVSATADVTTSVTPPANLTALPVAQTCVDLAWGDTSGSETSFQVERCQGSGCNNFTPLPALPRDSVTYRDCATLPSTSYTYRVKAANDGISFGGGSPWTGRIPVSISNFQPDYQIRVVIPYTNGMKSDFSDLRFIDDQTGRELNYWLESKSDGISATAWFRTDRSAEVSVYYGNPTASSTSSMARTFLFSEDFSGDVSQWTLSGSPNPSLNIVNGAAFLSGGPPVCNEICYDTCETICSTNIVLSSNRQFVIGSGIAVTYDWNRPTGANAFFRHSLPGTNYTAEQNFGSVQSVYFYNSLTEEYYGTSGAPAFVNGWQTAGIGLTPTRLVGSYRNQLVSVAVTIPGDFSFPIRFNITDDAPTGVYLDNIKVRRFTAIEPVASLGTAETSAGYQFITWQSSFSNSASVMTGTPTAPNLPTATVLNTTDVKLTWTDNSQSESGFTIERCQGSGCTNFSALPQTAPANAATFTDTTAAPGTTYRYQIRASHVDPVWATAPTAVVQGTTTMSQMPVLSSVTAVSASQINLVWTDPNIDESGFLLERCKEGICGGAETYTSIPLPSNQTSYSDTGLLPSTGYCYRLSTLKGSPPVWILTTPLKCDKTFPQGPTTLTAVAINGFTVNLGWTDTSTDEDGFIVEKKTLTNDWVQLATLPAGRTSYTDKIGNRPARNFTYRIRAYRGPDISAPSNEATARTLPYTTGDGDCK